MRKHDRYVLGSYIATFFAVLFFFTLIVVVIGGMGSLVGTAVAAVAVGLVQQLANFYAASGVGDLSVVLLLALVLLLRPTSMKGAHA